MEYHIATKTDAAAIAVMNAQLIKDEGHRNTMSVQELEARMAGWLAGEYSAVVLVESGSPVGYALFREEPEYIYLRQLFVHRDRGAKGAIGPTWAINRKSALY
jgi:hypothetical protein